MPRAPRTRIPELLDRLAQVEFRNQQIERQNKINRGRLVGTLAGAGIAAATGNPLPVIAASGNIGGQVGGATQGGQIDPANLLQSSLTAAQIMDQQAQVESERKLLGDIAPTPQVNLNPADIPAGAGTTEPIPGLGAPLPASAQSDAYSRILQAAQDSSTPLKTAMTGLSLLRAAQPQQGEGFTLSPGQIRYDAAGRPVAAAPAAPEKPAQPKGSPRQVWVNEAQQGQPPKWSTQSVTNNTQFDQLVGQFGPHNVLLEDPTKTGAGDAKTREERDRQTYIRIGLKKARGEYVSPDEALQQNLAKQALMAPVSYMDPIMGPQKRPGYDLSKLDQFIAAEAKRGQGAAAKAAPGATESTAPPPPAKPSADLIPVPEPKPEQGLSPAQRSDIQGKVVTAQESRARVEETMKEFKPSYLTLGGKAYAKGTALAESLLGEWAVPESAQQYLADYTKFRVNALSNLNKYIHDLTGAQLSAYEADRLRQAIADPQNMSPTEFQSAANAILEQGRRAEARYQRLLARGVIQPGQAVTDEVARQHPLANEEPTVGPAESKQVQQMLGFER